MICMNKTGKIARAFLLLVLISASAVCGQSEPAWPPWGDDFWDWLLHGSEAEPAAERPVTEPCDKGESDPYIPPEIPPLTISPPTDGVYLTEVAVNFREGTSAEASKDDTLLAILPQGWLFTADTANPVQHPDPEVLSTVVNATACFEEWWAARLKKGSFAPPPEPRIKHPGYCTYTWNGGGRDDRYMIPATADDVFHFLIENTPHATELTPLITGVSSVPGEKWNGLPCTEASAMYPFGMNVLVEKGCEDTPLETFGGTLSPGLVFEVETSSAVVWPEGATEAMIVNPIPSDIVATMTKSDTLDNSLLIQWQGFFVLVTPLVEMPALEGAVHPGDLLGYAGGEESKTLVQWIVMSPETGNGPRVLVNPLFFFNETQAGNNMGWQSLAEIPDDDSSPYQLGWYVNNHTCGLAPEVNLCPKIKNTAGVPGLNVSSSFAWKLASDPVPNNDGVQPESHDEDQTLAAGFSFTKYWIVQNTGTATWTPDNVVLEYISGKNTTTQVALPPPDCSKTDCVVGLREKEKVSQGQMRKFCMNIVTPKESGTYELKYSFARIDENTGDSVSFGPPLVVQLTVDANLIPPVVQFHSPLNPEWTPLQGADIHWRFLYGPVDCDQSKVKPGNCPNNQHWHAGIDMWMPDGTVLYPIGPGKIVRQGSFNAAGYALAIRHTLLNGSSVFSIYEHLQPNSFEFKEGDSVDGTLPIAKSGITGNWGGVAHLHFGMTLNETMARDLRGYIPTCTSAGEAKFQMVDPEGFMLLYNQEMDNFSIERHKEVFDPATGYAPCGGVPGPGGETYSASLVSRKPPAEGYTECAFGSPRPQFIYPGQISFFFTFLNTGTATWEKNTAYIINKSGYPGLTYAGQYNEKTVPSGGKYEFRLDIGVKPETVLDKPIQYVNLQDLQLIVNGEIIQSGEWVVCFDIVQE